MTGVAPADETAATPPAAPAPGGQFAGESPRASEESAPLAIDGQAVQIAYLHGSRVSHSWHVSMMNLVAYDKTVGLDVIKAMPFAVSCSGPNSLPEGRNMAVQHFLDKTDAGWLFFVDTDMGFRPESLEQLLLAADETERPVVGGLCFAMKHIGPDGHGGFNVRPIPTLFEWAHHPKQGVGFANRFIYPPETLVHVAGTGAAFLLIHRSVLEAIRTDMGDAWFNLRTYDDGSAVSEDLSFCWRVAQIGKRVFVHTGVKITHHKEVWLGEGDYNMPEAEPMGALMMKSKQLGHPGSDRRTGGDRKDEA